MDSILNIKPKAGLIVFRITEIIAETKEFKIVSDQLRRWHKINRTDITVEKWPEIKVGQDLGAVTEESIKRLVVLPAKPEKAAEEKISLDSDFMWYCQSCGAKGVVSSRLMELGNLVNGAEEICHDHES